MTKKKMFYGVVVFMAVFFVLNVGTVRADDARTIVTKEGKIVSNLEMSSNMEMSSGNGSIEITNTYWVTEGVDMLMNLSFPQKLIPNHTNIEVFFFAYEPGTDSWYWKYVGLNPQSLDSGFYRFQISINNPYDIEIILAGFDLAGTVNNPAHFLFGWYDMSASEIRVYQDQKAMRGLPRNDLYLLVNIGYMSKMSTKSIFWILENSEKYRDIYEVEGMLLPDEEGIATIPVSKKRAEKENRILTHEKPFVVVMKLKSNNYYHKSSNERK